MKNLLLILILNFGHLPGISQQIFTIRLLDSESSQPVKQAKIFSKDKVLNSNHLGFFQVEANANDTILIEHNDYQTASLGLPKETSFQVKLTKNEEELKCVWSAVNFTEGDYYYYPIKVSTEKIKEDTYVYLILSKKKAYFIVNSSNLIICNPRTLKLIGENVTVDLMTVEKKKTTFQVLPDKINRGRYFTIGEKEKEGLYFNVFEIAMSQINQLRNQTIKSIHLGEEFDFELDEMSGRKAGKMFDCVE